jgi:hypothetical protein
MGLAVFQNNNPYTGHALIRPTVDMRTAELGNMFLRIASFLIDIVSTKGCRELDWVTMDKEDVQQSMPFNGIEGNFSVYQNNDDEKSQKGQGNGRSRKGENSCRQATGETPLDENDTHRELAVTRAIAVSFCKLSNCNSRRLLFLYKTTNEGLLPTNPPSSN